MVLGTEPSRGFRGRRLGPRASSSPAAPAAPRRTSCEPCEKLSRAMFIPALIISLRRSTERDAGPGTRDPAQTPFSPNRRVNQVPHRLRRRPPRRGPGTWPCPQRSPCSWLRNNVPLCANACLPGAWRGFGGDVTAACRGNLSKLRGTARDRAQVRAVGVKGCRAHRPHPD